jgi:hypothetical protein
MVGHEKQTRLLHPHEAEPNPSRMSAIRGTAENIAHVFRILTRTDVAPVENV